MKTPRFFWTSSALCLILASCDKTKPSAAGAANPEAVDALAAERAALEDERLTLERERLEEERAALEEEKEALRAEREARLASREEEVESGEMSLEERQRELDERDASLGDREGDLAQREANLSDQELELAGQESLDDWEPEYEPEVSEPVADYGTFYDDLQSYGSWYETPDYGYVYQPTVVVQDTSWRPYTRGRWACTNLGWNWVSDEPFGWACFHYGRWTLISGRGWVWVPGDEWAPSWVCWREGGDHIGWAPLPPETLCYRGRGWSSSVEADFGIGSACFSFVHRRHMADHLWRHCLPLEQNRHCIQQTANITNIKFHRDRIVCGGPRYDRLRHEVGKPWPVYQIETDRFKAIRDLNRRNANIRGNQLAVFAPNLNAQWNGQLKPSRLAGKWDDVKVVRAESGIKPEWTERFREARQKQKSQVETKEGADRAVAAKTLEANRTKVAAAQEKLQAKQQEQTEARRTKLMIQREAKDLKFPGGVAERPDRDAKPGDAANSKPTLAERQRQAVERLREGRAQRNPQTAESKPEREAPAGRVTRDREIAGRGRSEESGKQPEVSRERPGMARETPVPTQPEQARQNPGLPEGVTRRAERAEQPARGQGQAERVAEQTARREQMEEARQQQQEQARQRQEQAKNDSEQSNRRQQMEEARQQQEQAKGNEEESTRRERMEEARRQQQEAARGKAEEARQQQQQMEEARRNQQEEARERQEQARREAEEGNRRQQQEEMRRQQQEQARQEREENARRQQEEQARQQERMREQQEERARQQEESRREQEERSRQQQEERARQQEERARQQEEARRESQERARQQQEEQQRRQEERAREQEEKREERQRGR